MIELKSPNDHEFSMQDYLAMEEMLENVKVKNNSQGSFAFERHNLEMDPNHLQYPSPISTHSVDDNEPLPIAKRSYNVVASLADEFVSLFDGNFDETRNNVIGNRNCCVQNTVYQPWPWYYRSQFSYVPLKPHNFSHYRYCCTYQVPYSVPQKGTIARTINGGECVNEPLSRERGSLVLEKIKRRERSRVDVSNKKSRHHYKCGVCGEKGCTGLARRAYCPTRKQQIIQPKTYTRRCAVCMMFGPHWLNCGKGSGNRKLCVNFHLDGDIKVEK
jgi:hypothetical protein